MTSSDATPQTIARPEPGYWSRFDTAQAFDDFSDPFHPPCSQREYAQQQGIPRSTLGYWLRKDFPDHLDPAVVSFFRSVAGLAWLRRLVLALLLVFRHRNPCGIRAIGHFLELAELDCFVASSYGALYDLDQHLQDDLILFAKEERSALAEGMRAKDIAVCGDENFHGPYVCLVGIEPVSNFILAETYKERRDGATWTEVLTAGIAGLPVVFVAFTSDQGKGLIACASELEAQYTPELFHGQRDLAQPLLAALQREITSLEKELEGAQKQTQRCQEKKEKAEKRGDSDQAIEQEWQRVLAEGKERPIILALEGEQKRKEQAVAALRGVADDYHPFDAQTGAVVDAPEVQKRLQERLNTLEKVAFATGITQKMEEALEKGKKWITALVATMAWFWTLARQRVEEMDLPEEAEKVVLEKLLAGLYWQEAAKRGRTAEDRQDQKELAERLLQEAWAEGGALSRLSEARKEEVLQWARQMVGLFSRSSSCVEGRNGRLSLFHHGQTRLSEKRLQALTAVHNYVVKRQDGTTAAERFFGKKQRDAFTWLLQRMPELPRPAAKRRKLADEAGSVAA